MSYSNIPVPRAQILAWLSTQGDDVKDYEDMSDHEIRVMYEERRKGDPDYIDEYNEPTNPLDDERDIDEKTR